MRPSLAIATATILFTSQPLFAQALPAPAMPDLPHWTATHLPEWSGGAPSPAPAPAQPLVQVHSVPEPQPAWSAVAALPVQPMPVNGPAYPMLIPPGVTQASAMDRPINVINANQQFAPAVNQPSFAPPLVHMAYSQSPPAPDIDLPPAPSSAAAPQPNPAPQVNSANAPPTFMQGQPSMQLMPDYSQGMPMQPGFPGVPMQDGMNMGMAWDSNSCCGECGNACGCSDWDWVHMGDLMPYGYGGVYAGNNRVTNRAGVFLPFWQSDSESVVFADIRGQWDDQDAAEANLGLGYRMFLDPFWVFGNYIYWDILSTNQDNVFHQATVGFELMSLDWDARVNITFPGSWDSPAKTESGTSNRTVITRNFQERAYPGFDAEIGHRFLHWGWNDRCELRWFVGGYYFEHSAEGYPSFGGPRGRIEFRIHDLGWLGTQSRLTMGVEGAYDRLNDEQVAGFMRVQIPLGRKSGRVVLDPLRRRFVDTPVRDID